MPKRKATDRVGWRPASQSPTPTTKTQPADRRETETHASSPQHETLSVVPAKIETENSRAARAGRAELSVETTTRKQRVAATESAITVNDKRARWAPGQWDAWKVYFAQQDAVNQSLPRSQRTPLRRIVDDFNETHAAHGWAPKTTHAIRAQRARVGEADVHYVANRLSQRERRRALELFTENGGSWVKAVEVFNAETGRSLTRGALIASARRFDPTDPIPDVLSVSIPTATRTARPWSETELDAVAALARTNQHDQQVAYVKFVETMRITKATYEPRSYQAFLSQLSLARRTVAADKGTVERQQRRSASRNHGS